MIDNLIPWTKGKETMTTFDKELVDIILNTNGIKNTLEDYKLSDIVDMVNNAYDEPFRQARVINELLRGTLTQSVMLDKEDMEYINDNVLDITVMNSVLEEVNNAVLTNKKQIVVDLATTVKTIKFITDMIEEKGFEIKYTGGHPVFTKPYEITLRTEKR